MRVRPSVVVAAVAVIVAWVRMLVVEAVVKRGRGATLLLFLRGILSPLIRRRQGLRCLVQDVSNVDARGIWLVIVPFLLFVVFADRSLICRQLARLHSVVSVEIGIIYGLVAQRPLPRGIHCASCT